MIEYNWLVEVNVDDLKVDDQHYNELVEEIYNEDLQQWGDENL